MGKGEGRGHQAARNFGNGGGVDLIVEKGRTGRRPEIWERGEGSATPFTKCFQNCLRWRASKLIFPTVLKIQRRRSESQGSSVMYTAFLFVMNLSSLFLKSRDLTNRCICDEP